jgi:5-methyltetrahydrofolate--homocysteine methyltransferase
VISRGDKQPADRMNVNKKLYDAVIHGDATQVTELARRALADGVDPRRLVEGTMVPAMDEVGARFARGEFFIPELLICARAMKAGMGLIRPLLAEGGAGYAGCVVIGTVYGDQHDIGKNLVASMLEGGGFEVVDLGFDVAPDRFVRTVIEHKADLIGLSALLTTTMPMMRTVIEEVERAALRGHTKIMIGGAPITRRFADEIGADGYAADAGSAVTLARSLLAHDTAGP